MTRGVMQMAQNRRMVIFTQGGLIQDIFTDFETDVVILDPDLEGGDDQEISSIQDMDGKSNSYHVSKWNVPPDPKTTQHFIQQINGGIEHEKTQ
jgi:hypothetical protein